MGMRATTGGTQLQCPLFCCPLRYLGPQVALVHRACKRHHIVLRMWCLGPPLPLVHTSGAQLPVACRNSTLSLIAWASGLSPFLWWSAPPFPPLCSSGALLLQWAQTSSWVPPGVAFCSPVHGTLLLNPGVGLMNHMVALFLVF